MATADKVYEVCLFRTQGRDVSFLVNSVPHLVLEGHASAYVQRFYQIIFERLHVPEMYPQTNTWNDAQLKTKVTQMQNVILLFI